MEGFTDRRSGWEGGKETKREKKRKKKNSSKERIVSVQVTFLWGMEGVCQITSLALTS